MSYVLRQSRITNEDCTEFENWGLKVYNRQYYGIGSHRTLPHIRPTLYPNRNQSDDLHYKPMD